MTPPVSNAATSSLVSQPIFPRLLFGALWLAFIIYGVGFAPPDDPNTLNLIGQLSTGQWGALNPLVVSLFNLMGVWPLAYMLLLLPDGHRRSGVPAWPFVTASFGLGAFAILPYLALRGAVSDDPPAFDASTRLGRWRQTLLLSFQSWGWAIFLGLNAVGWLAYGLGWGNWTDFGQQWHSSRFIHVMSLDFCVLTLLYPFLIWETIKHSQKET